MCSRRKTVEQLTSNEYYAGLNRRWLRRAQLLYRLGFRYVQLAPGVAGMQRTRFHNTTSIPVALLSHADNRAWFAYLSHTLR